MKYLRFVSSSSMLLSLLVIDIPHVVIGSLSQNRNEFHDRAVVDGYDLDEGPVVYQAYYPDYQNLDWEKKSLYREPIIHDSWKIHYNTVKARPKYVDNQNSNDYSLPLSSQSSEDNRVIDSNQHDNGESERDRDNQEVDYKRRLQNVYNIFVESIGRQVKKSIDQQSILNNLRHQGNLVAKTYLKYWQLANDLVPQGEYNVIRQLPSTHTNGHGQSIESTLSKENILQPRPQVINYISHPPVNAFNQMGESNVPIKHDTVQNDVLQSNQHPRIDSIKIQGKLVHKTRHHHGEKIRRYF